MTTTTEQGQKKLLRQWMLDPAEFGNLRISSDPAFMLVLLVPVRTLGCRLVFFNCYFWQPWLFATLFIPTFLSLNITDSHHVSIGIGLWSVSRPCLAALLLVLLFPLVDSCASNWTQLSVQLNVDSGCKCCFLLRVLGVAALVVDGGSNKSPPTHAA